MHVMLIDDNPQVLNIMRRLLLLNGFSNETFTDPVKAMDAFAAGNYDVVVTDYQMPVVNGVEVARAIRQQKPGARIVLISGHVDLQDMLDPEEHIDAIFPKPLVMGSFMNLLSRFSRELDPSHNQPYIRVS